MNQSTEAVKTESSKFCILGNVDAGKSSFVGVLTHNVRDDGNGFARSKIVKLKHETDSGRTSSHSQHYIINGNEITTLIDLCGHEKYLKTTMFGVSGLFGDYGIVMIGANMGVSEMTYEHTKILLAKKIPFMFVVTKIDICPENINTELKRDINIMCKKLCSRRQLIYLETSQTLDESHGIIIDSFQNKLHNIIPTIFVSNKTGHNIDFVKNLLTTIKPNVCTVPESTIVESTYPPVLYIDNTYAVPGFEIILSGTLKYGDVVVGQKMVLGPVNKQYIAITVKSIHNCISENVQRLHQNESGSLGIRVDVKNTYNRSMFKKGQIATTSQTFAINNTCMKCNCDVAIFDHPTSIKNGYQAMIHCKTIRQVARFQMPSDVVLRTNCRQNIDMEFMIGPEFILPGSYFMFRDGNTKGMGLINATIPMNKPI